MSVGTDGLAQEIDDLYRALRAREFDVESTLRLITAWLSGGGRE